MLMQHAADRISSLPSAAFLEISRGLASFISEPPTYLRIAQRRYLAIWIEDSVPRVDPLFFGQARNNSDERRMAPILIIQLQC